MSCCRCVGSAFAARPLMCSASLLPRALAVVTSAHQPRASVRACGHTGVGLAVHAWACVGVRGPTPRVQRACVAACLQLRGTRPRQPSAAIPGLRATDTQRTKGASFSSGARGWIMRMGTWRGHTSSMCLISLITGSAPSHQVVDRLGWCPHRAPPAALSIRTSAHDVVA